MKSPVAVLIFNRPEETARVLEAVCRAKPPMLLVVADGPRTERIGEASRCAATRAVLDRFDWKCEIRTNFSAINLGCKRRVAGGLDWVFETVPEAIILEDDCLPDESFFQYCEELLDRYRDDDRVMHIGGNNFGIDVQSFDSRSYGFSSFAQVWGWASWRRAWSHFDVNIAAWPDFRRQGGMRGLPLTAAHRAIQEKRWVDVYSGRVDTWDFQWHFSLMSRKGLAIVPSSNLVTNIGFSAQATHTTDTTSDKSKVPLRPMQFPLVHPSSVAANGKIDRDLSEKMLGKSLAGKLIDRGRRLLYRRRRH